MFFYFSKSSFISWNSLPYRIGDISFIHFVYSFNTQVFSATNVPVCVLRKGTVPFLPIKSSYLKGKVGEEAENYVIRWEVGSGGAQRKTERTVRGQGGCET